MTRRIVVGVDGSPNASAALRWALSHAQALEAEVTAVLAWQMPFLSHPGAFDSGEVEGWAKAALLDAVTEAAPAPAVPLEAVVAEGDPTESLTEAAKGADLLVVGARGRGRFAPMAIGWVAVSCAAHAPCPVVIVRSAAVE
jgi:nucleotide-binding universal stress UspA family protein